VSFVVVVGNLVQCQSNRLLGKTWPVMCQVGCYAVLTHRLISHMLFNLHFVACWLGAYGAYSAAGWGQADGGYGARKLLFRIWF